MHPQATVSITTMEDLRLVATNFPQSGQLVKSVRDFFKEKKPIPAFVPKRYRAESQKKDS